MNTFLSVLAAMFGVQSEAKRQDDFRRPSALPFILVGIGVIALFVITLIVIVQWVLS